MWNFKAVVTLSTSRFTIQNFYILPTQCILMFYVNLRTKLWLFLYTALNDWFYNREGECLQRGSDWVFKYSWGEVQYAKG
jgi:hypothetical protein